MHTHNTTYEVTNDKVKQKAQLPKRDIARCYVSKSMFSQGTGVGNASNSKIKLQSHSKAPHWKWCHLIGDIRFAITG